MNNTVKIKIFTKSIKFQSFLIYNKISYSNLEKYNDYYIIDIYYNDIKLFNRYEYSVIKYYGIKGIINYINYNKQILIGILCGLLIIVLLSNTIFDVVINSNNKELINIINNSLYKNDIVKYKKKKSFDDLVIIKNNILEENKNKLEWIEIINDGCTYKIELTERVLGNNIYEENEPCNIVANKDGLIKHINLINGVKIKDVNDYVKKGDVIITGNVIKNEKIVNQIKSIGNVYAEVWYTIKVTIPFNYTEYVETGKIINHYYIKIFDKTFTIMGKYDSDNTMNEKKIILNKPYLFFDLYKETKKEYKYKKISINKKTAYDEGILRAEKKISNTLEKDEYIISKNVLKKDVFSSKMELEIFFKVYENITGISGIEEVIND